MWLLILYEVIAADALAILLRIMLPKVPTSLCRLNILLQTYVYCYFFLYYVIF